MSPFFDGQQKNISDRSTMRSSELFSVAPFITNVSLIVVTLTTDYILFCDLKNISLITRLIDFTLLMIAPHLKTIKPRCGMHLFVLFLFTVSIFHFIVL